jgi:hypothetical protein
VALTIARPVPDRFFGTQPNAFVIRDLRVAFQVQKNSGKEPNTATIVISNLSQQSRAELQKKPLHIKLEAGYDGRTELLAEGDLRWAESIPEGPNWTTKIEIADGSRMFAGARVNRSFGPGVKKKDALNEVAKAMGLKLPAGIENIIGAASQFVSGLTLQGPAHKEMTRLLEPHGAEWSVQNGQLQILRNQDARPDQGYVVSQETGMIGSPCYGAPPAKGQPPTLKVKMLLFPALLPGTRIQVQSGVEGATIALGKKSKLPAHVQAINGAFKIERLTHAGDTHGVDWFTDLESKPL